MMKHLTRAGILILIIAQLVVLSMFTLTKAQTGRLRTVRPDGPDAPQLRHPVDSPRLAGSYVIFEARGGETVSQVAARYNVSVEEINRLNGIAPEVPLARGQKIRIPQIRVPALPVALISVKNLPPNFTGNNPANIIQSLGRIKKDLDKSKFETTSDYYERISKQLNHLSVDGQAKASDELTIVIWKRIEDYDADSKLYTVKLHSGSTFLNTLPTQRGSTDLSLSDNEVHEVIIGEADKTIGTAVGRNAFGVRKRYTIRSYATIKLVIPSSKATAWSDGLTLPNIEPSAARQMMGHVCVILRGRLAFPFTSVESDYDAATLTEPEESHFRDFSIYFEPNSIIAFNQKTGEVLGQAALTPEAIGTYDFNRGLILQKFTQHPEPVLTAASSTEHHMSDTKAPLITFKPQPAFTAEARDKGISGVVRLRMLLNADGSIGDIEVIQGLPFGLTEKAIDAAKQLKFVPATKDGKPVSRKVVFEYNFNLVQTAP